MRRALALGAALALAASPSGAQDVEEGFRVETVARLEFPVGLQFTPSGDRLFVNERPGRIRIIRDGRLLNEPFAEIETTDAGEQGLLGLALHPDFEEGEPWVYVFHTLPDGSANRVTRLRAEGDRAGARETVIERMPASGIHNGGAIAFGPDGKLYVTNGDAGEAQRAQDPGGTGGKVYRVDPDGSIPDDNPFRGSMTWSYGHRNPFGIAFDPVTDNLWESENGPAGNDEVNLIEPGENYGWPAVQGDAGNPAFRDPVVNYERTIVPTMMTFSGEAFPESHRGDLFLGSCAPGYCSGGGIRRLRLTDDRREVAGDTSFLRLGEGVVGLASGPDGLYFTTPTRVMRVSPRERPSPISPPAGTAAAASPPPARAENGPWPWPWIAVGVGAAAAGLGVALLRRSRRGV